MTELRDLLGDRYKATIQAAVLADNPKAITNAQQVGDNLGQLMYLSAVDRLDRVLTAILLDLLAQAWDEGFDAGERDAMDAAHTSGDSPCIPNPYRQESGRG